MHSVSTCPLCGQPHSSLFDQRVFHAKDSSGPAQSTAGIKITNRLCETCGLVYQSPRMSDQELDEFYKSEYRQLYQGSQGPSAKDLAVQRQRAQSLVEFVQDIIPSVSRHLDIGCSAGLLLQAVTKRYQSEAVGIEPGEAYRVYAQEQGISVYPALDPAVFQSWFQRHASPAGGELPDLVSLAHVIEHLPNPGQTLVELRERWLAPNGWLLIETPNLYGHDCFEVAHLVSYSSHTLTQMLLRAGYEISSIKIHGLPRSQILPLYITLLARPNQTIPTAFRCFPPAASGRLETQPENRTDWQRPVAGIPIKENSVRRKRRSAMLRRWVLTRLRPRQAWLAWRPVTGVA